MRRIMSIMAFTGGLLGLGNYVWDGWTMAFAGRNLYVPSNIVSVLLLAIAGSAAATVLLHDHGRMTEEERKEYRATLVLSAAALAILSSWILFRAVRTG
jgi:ABC-type dipeptide/oligopeptide/nickel transport system permease subunit